MYTAILFSFNHKKIVHFYDYCFFCDKIGFEVKYMIRFIYYPKCSTCIKAKKFLLNNQISFEERHIVENKLSKEELQHLYKKSGLPLKKFFNTSGKLYKENKLKDKLPTMNEDQQLELLASNGMLVKRPILETEDKVLVGFKEVEYQKVI